jgi:1,4-alpha-glucan branching enzyme
MLTDFDVHLFKEGNHFRLYEKLGAHVFTESEPGTFFSVWAPNANRVTVIGDFNGWDKDAHPMNMRHDGSGVWELWIPGVGQGALYKYHIHSNFLGYKVDKQDPFGFYGQVPPDNASVVWSLDYEWRDHEWLANRHHHNNLAQPINVYEIHLGSWRRGPDNSFLNYRDMAQPLIEYLTDLSYTHVEFLPVMEHPFYPSWGYQMLGYFSPTSRFGSPQDLMYLIDELHRHGIGVILDWVPSHFPSDEHGLAFFDGTALFEHADPRKGFHPDWGSYIFNYGRHEISAFLMSSALFWLDRYHADALRVDAVASMLYLDYSRKEGEWIPNQFGGRENIEAIEFLKTLNHTVYSEYPDVHMIAEESTSWTKVSKPVHEGGLGFGMKWNMGWMNDVLEYMSNDPLFRKFHHNELTFSMLYAYTENFMLSLSHDEVVHGKCSLIGKMPGYRWDQFANMRLLIGFMMTHPGKKLNFMGFELGQWREWNHDQSLDWDLLAEPDHRGLQHWVRDVNRLYRQQPALFQLDFTGDGFRWIECNDCDRSVFGFVRKGHHWEDDLVIVCHFTPIRDLQYRLGVPHAGFWRELLNSDALCYGGSGAGNAGGVHTDPIPMHGFPQSILVNVPPLSTLILKR